MTDLQMTDLQPTTREERGALARGYAGPNPIELAQRLLADLDRAKQDADGARLLRHLADARADRAEQERDEANQGIVNLMEERDAAEDRADRAEKERDEANARADENRDAMLRQAGLIADQSRSIKAMDSTLTQAEEQRERLQGLAEFVAGQQPEALRIVRENGFVFEDIGKEPGNWQHLAFTLYSMLCEAEGKASAILNQTHPDQEGP